MDGYGSIISCMVKRRCREGCLFFVPRATSLRTEKAGWGLLSDAIKMECRSYLSPVYLVLLTNTLTNQFQELYFRG